MKRGPRLLAIALLLFSACATRRDRSLDNPDYAIVKVFYGTDRNETGNKTPAKFYGADRGSFSYGVCEVSIPRDHRMGELEKASLLRLELRQDPKKHVVLLSVSPQNAADFFNALTARINDSPRKQAFVFVHGYNVTFENAARRTAQMAYDLAFEGAAILYSWPSKGTLTGYPIDGTNVQWSMPHLKTFLAGVATRTGAQTVHLIAHSMGNRALAGAVQALWDENRPEIHSVFREIVLTAPDIDAEIFRRDIAPRLVSLPTRITLYASSADKALHASKTYHQYPRAGDSAASMALIEKIDAIDATAVETGFLGHSYYADNRSVIADLFYLLREGKPPAERFALERVSAGEGVYWRFKK